MSPATPPRRWRRLAAATALACAVGAFVPPAAAATAAPVPGRAPAPAPVPEGAGPDTGAGASSVPRLDWAPCLHTPRYHCATARVPLDHRRPWGRTIELALIKRPAVEPHRRVGSLFYHPGLRADGTAALRESYEDFPLAVRKRFDLVSWDMRGTGQSTPVRCFRSTAQALRWAEKLPDGFPVGARERKVWIRSWAELGRRCAERAPALLRHMSAADTARDLDLLRAAVGDRRLNYLGTSYGTFVGATYANLFPHRVRAMTLDSNVNPREWVRRGSWLPTFLRQDFDLASAQGLSRFLDLCGRSTPDDCAFSAGNPQATRTKFERLLHRLRHDPQGYWTYAATVSFVVLQLRDVDPGWTELADKLQELWEDSAPAGPGSGLRARTLPAPSHAPTHTDDDYPGYEWQYAMMCGESPNPRDPRRYRAIERFSRARAGDPGSYWTWRNEPCATWPVRAANPYTGPWDRYTAAPVLTVGITNDPTTPYEGSLAMTRQLANARLLTVKGDGHMALMNPSDCVKRHESRYFIKGVLPPRGTVCRQDHRPFGPLG
ncbi:alpha/beta hydrolase [Streptomyces sp. WAC 00631]|uniref:alpha/beta hydrolase n=1 Tax=unclassified Streptomyces TaxID=2593676 RepID=UPI000F76B06E|nr:MULTISPECIES: alpha/beta hydrolase [unclassified Streptomyces]MCC5031778.1 alpha/beta hydrolase [Streptomyces sp. WAC 00631]MCC9739915.1 alpha/beta hydrolase [Streptomyces sp. MNU89]